MKPFLFRKCGLKWRTHFVDSPRGRVAIEDVWGTSAIADVGAAAADAAAAAVAANKCSNIAGW